MVSNQKRKKAGAMRIAAGIPKSGHTELDDVGRRKTGYTLVEVKTTKYGYHYFKYVWMPPKSKEKRRLEITGGGLVS